MRRRVLIAILGGVALLWPLAGSPQQPTQHRIAVVTNVVPANKMNETGDEGGRAFFGELRRLGYVEGQNLVVERYSVEGHTERHVDLAKEVISRNPELIVVFSNFTTGIYKQATSTIPIVADIGDPVAAGLVASLAHPGGNITGIIGDAGSEIIGKRLQLLKEAIPSASRVALLLFEDDTRLPSVKRFHETAAGLGMNVIEVTVRNSTEAEIRRAFDTMTQDRPDALFVSARSDFYGQRKIVAELIQQARLPAMCPQSAFVKLGALMSYSADVLDELRRLADYVDFVLKGAKPADLPIEQATKFKLVISLKAARSLGLTIPDSLLARADEVIE
jgi:putative ABC transport system substrate-binding protein